MSVMRRNGACTILSVAGVLLLSEGGADLLFRTTTRFGGLRRPKQQWSSSQCQSFCANGPDNAFFLRSRRVFTASCGSFNGIHS